MIKFLEGNKITLLQNGADYFPALETAIDRAARWVYIETYIFANDSTGQRIAAALLRAAQRGVAVHLLIDGYGAKAYPTISLQALIGAGADVLIYRPGISPYRFQRQRLRRLHRKLAVSDRGRLILRVVDEFLSLTAAPDSILPSICAKRSAGRCPLHTA